ncbi:hypothetical protein GWK47_028183 [Chionoecetes opilio]|uniref:EGF-like domain-containing protein n=1 Tax=Chionoecetes opilio TaxID=41210 RepID=A0A8J4YLL7_CHIOP|nr:hypothetical protein GWK47_028183 [Chionoecetes opilio]
MTSVIRRTTMTYKGGGKSVGPGGEGSPVPLQSRVKKAKIPRGGSRASLVAWPALCVLVFLSVLVLTCHARPNPSSNGHSDLSQPASAAEWAEQTASILPEITKHTSTVTVQDQWETDYCDVSSKLFNELFEKMNTLLTFAATSDGLEDEYKRYQNMQVFPTSNPGACDALVPPARQRGAAVPLSLVPKGRAKRQVSPPEDLTVIGEMVMRTTDHYDNTTNKAMEEALKDVITNGTITADLDIDVDEDSVSVEGVKDQVCGVDVICHDPERADCYTEHDPVLGALRAICRCHPQYEDVSPNNVTRPGETCADPCTRNFCSNAGTCIREEIFYSRLCSCEDWHLGETCYLNMIGVIFGVGIAIGLMTIALLSVILSGKRKGNIINTMSLERESVTRETSTPQIRSIYRLPEDSEVHIEQDTLPPIPRIPPRPQRTPPPSHQHQLAREEAHSEPTPVHDDAWFISRNIPRPRFSI